MPSQDQETSAAAAGHPGVRRGRQCAQPAVDRSTTCQRGRLPAARRRSDTALVPLSRPATGKPSHPCGRTADAQHDRSAVLPGGCHIDRLQKHGAERRYDTICMNHTYLTFSLYLTDSVRYTLRLRSRVRRPAALRRIATARYPGIPRIGRRLVIDSRASPRCVRRRPAAGSLGWPRSVGFGSTSDLFRAAVTRCGRRPSWPE